MSDTDYFIRRLAIWLGAGLSMASFSAYILFSAPRNFPAGQIIEIKKGAGLTEIAEGLKELGAIKSPYLFKAFMVLSSRQADIKAGRYFFEKPITMFEISKRLARGIYGIEPVKAVIIEGWSNEQIGGYFEKIGLFKKEDWTLATKGMEGYLFPDTYFLPPDAEPDTVIKIMRDNFDKKIISEFPGIEQEKNFTLSDLIIMASILEKEANSFQDARVISGILWKRLGAGMGLQVDATLTYITGKPSLKLTEEDLAIDSLYNTYKYRGLPPGPISNPGLNAMNAVIFMQTSPYWYYLHDREGQPHYAVTFEEHKKNKELYLR